MYALNCSLEDLEKALLMVNEKYDRNIQFRSLSPRNPNKILFTLKVKDTENRGSRRSSPNFSTGKQRKLPYACWHAHGDFFDALFEINPDAEVMVSFGRKKVITKDEGNWEDSNIGSQMFPFYFSEACNCHEFTDF